MIRKDVKTLKEVKTNLVFVSDVFESVRKKLAKFDKENLQLAQHHIVTAIETLNQGIRKVEQGVKAEKSKVNESKETTNGDETTR